MQIFIHRVNTIEKLQAIPSQYGVEIDVRGYGDTLLLNHDPIKNPADNDELEEYLKHYQHSGVIFNLKEAGYEARVIALAEKYGIENYFLLDVEFPYLYRASRHEGVRKIAVRYSEAEPIAMAEAQQGLVDWVWIDTNTKLPLDEEVVLKLAPFKTCLVSPCRWGRPDDIPAYIAEIEKLGFPLTAVMTELQYAPLWQKLNSA